LCHKRRITVDEMQHDAHMEKMKQGLAQILQIAQQMGVQSIVQIAQGLLGEEQAEQQGAPEGEDESSNRDQMIAAVKKQMGE
jgi:sugar phosphate isomerase/epimerase